MNTVYDCYDRHTRMILKLAVASPRHPEHGQVTERIRESFLATAGVDPEVMGSGPIPASRAALEKAGWSVGDLDLVEANEAFAAQACAVNRDMDWDPAIVNVNGGAIAIGHPLGATGTPVVVKRIDGPIVFVVPEKAAGSPGR